MAQILENELIHRASVFSPASLPNLKEWLRADAGTWQDNALTTAAVADGDPVGGWADQSGAGKNALQTTAGAKPTLKLGANGINGKAALSFDGGDWLATAAFASALSQPTTVYLVLKLTNTTNVNLGPFDGIAAGNRNTVFQAAGKWNQYAGSSIATAVAPNTNAHVIAAEFNAAASHFFIDNTDIAGVGSVGTNTLTGLTIGSNNSQSASSFIVGLIPELLIYSASHTPTQRGQVQAYLATKYGITLAP